jgi:heptosyltransferase-2
MQRIVVLLQSGIGDLVMAIPLLRTCINNLNISDQLVIFVDSKATMSILESALIVDNRVTINCLNKNWSSSYLSILKYIFILRRLQATLFLAPHSTNRFRVTLFAALVGAKLSILPHSVFNEIIFKKTVKLSMEHKVNYYLKFAEASGMDVSCCNKKIDIELSETQLISAKNIIVNWDPSQRWICFAPGSGEIERHKRWPSSSYSTLGEMILKKGPEFRIMIIGSVYEQNLLNEIKNDLKFYGSRVITIAVSEVMVTVAAISLCDCMVVGCSGSSHLASIVGTPVVGLYGPTNPGFTGPFFEKNRIVRVGLKCSPCYRINFNEGCGDPICMKMIEPREVEKNIMLSISCDFDKKKSWFKSTKASKPDLS